MIRIINITHPNSALSQSLDLLESEFSVQHTTKQAFIHEDVTGDIFIASADTLEKFADHLLSSMKVVIWLDLNDDVLKAYEVAKAKNAAAIISSHNLSKISQKFSELYQNFLIEKGKKAQDARYISVASFKAGVGTTLCAHHMTYHLSQLAKTPTLFVDYAGPLGSSKSRLNIESKYSWKTLQPTLSATLSASRVKNITLASKYSFEILAHPQDFEGDRLDLNEHQSLMQVIKKGYPITIEDTGTIVHKREIDRLTYADAVILILSPDPSAIFNTYNGLDILKKTLPPELPIFGVVNMFEQIEDWSLLTQLKQKFHLQLIDKVENDTQAVRHFSRKYELITDKSLIIYDDLKRVSEELFKKLW